MENGRLRTSRRNIWHTSLNTIIICGHEAVEFEMGCLSVYALRYYYMLECDKFGKSSDGLNWMENEWRVYQVSNRSTFGFKPIYIAKDYLMHLTFGEKDAQGGHLV